MQCGQGGQQEVFDEQPKQFAFYRRRFVFAEDEGDFGVVGLADVHFTAEVVGRDGFSGGLQLFVFAFFAFGQQGLRGGEAGFGEEGQRAGLADEVVGQPAVEDFCGLAGGNRGQGEDFVGQHPAAGEVAAACGADGVVNQVLQVEADFFGGVGPVVEEVDLAVQVQRGQAAVQGEAV